MNQARAIWRRVDEKAVADEDGDDASHSFARGRPPAVTSSTQRFTSPPNSVKAFAGTRRRGRELSVSGQGPAGGPEREGQDSVDGFSRPMPPGSRPHTTDRRSIRIDDDSISIKDVACCPTKREHHDERLHIDFDYLETIVKLDIRQEHTARRFPSLQPESTVEPATLTTADGRFKDIPYHQASHQDKKITGGQTNASTKKRHNHQNKFSFFSSAWESTIHAAKFGDLILPAENVQDLFRVSQGKDHGVWWLHMDGPTNQEVRTICKAFHIHPLTVEDILTQENHEKIELFLSYYFACLRTFKRVDGASRINYIPFNIYVVVFREGILSFCFEHDAHTPQVRSRISKLKNQLSLTSDWICYALIDDIVDSLAPAIHEVEQETGRIEDELFIARPNDDHEFLRRIAMARKKIMDLMRLLCGKSDILRGFMKRCNANFATGLRMDITLYLGDVQDHAVTMTNSLVHFERILSRLHSNYLAHLSIGNIDQGNQTNEALKRVTVITTILVPLFVVCQIFGMNIKVPWEDTSNLNAFSGIVGGIFFLGLVGLIIARWVRYV